MSINTFHLSALICTPNRKLEKQCVVSRGFARGDFQKCRCHSGVARQPVAVLHESAGGRSSFASLAHGNIVPLHAFSLLECQLNTREASCRVRIYTCWSLKWNCFGSVGEVSHDRWIPTRLQPLILETLQHRMWIVKTCSNYVSPIIWSSHMY